VIMGRKKSGWEVDMNWKKIGGKEEEERWL
jgi:hypothetical protein